MNPIKFCLPILVVFSLACNDEKARGLPINAPPVSPNQPPEEELTPTSNDVTYSSGWTEAVIVANSAKTTVDIGAHFSTTRNACGREAYGPIDLVIWNKFALNTNLAALKIQSGGTPYCTAPPVELNRTMDGTV